MVITVTLNPAMDKSLTLDEFSLGEVNRATSVRQDVGGKGINVSKVLKEFAIESVAIGFLGETNEEFFRSELKKNGIMEKLLTVEGSTRTNTKIIDKKNNLVTEINEPGPIVSKRDLLKLYQLFEELVKPKDIVVLSGSLSQGVPDDIYSVLTEKAKKRDALVIVDAEGEYLKLAIEKTPDMIKPNEKEFADFLGIENPTSEDLIAGAKKVIRRGVGKVLISRGENGSVLITKSGIYESQGLKVEMKSTVGAGDSMVAALVYSELNLLDDIHTLLMAESAGIAAVMREGSEPCTLNEVLKVAGEIEKRMESYI